MTLLWKVGRITCPECRSDDVFAKYDEYNEYQEKCCIFYCECNECGCVWETDVKVTEYTHEGQEFSAVLEKQYEGRMIF